MDILWDLIGYFNVMWNDQQKLADSESLIDAVTEIIMCNFIISTVPVDDLAPLGA